MKKSTVSTSRQDALKSRQWYLVDVTNLPVGRAASQIARVLKGKHKPTYTPSMDVGDFVVVINAEKVRFTGTKEQKKTYFKHTMYPGGETLTPAFKVRQRHPEDLIKDAVRRMIPRSTLGHHMMRKLKVYKGDKHPHTAQKPQALTLAL